MMEPTPFETVQQIASGHILPRCLHVIADLGVADALDETPRGAHELAARVGAHPDALGRVLRLLAAHGVFAVQGDTVRHTPASRLLRSDHPRSLRPFVRMFGLPVNWATYGALERALGTGVRQQPRCCPRASGRTWPTIHTWARSSTRRWKPRHRATSPVSSLPTTSPVSGQ